MRTDVVPQTLTHSIVTIGRKREIITSTVDVHDFITPEVTHAYDQRWTSGLDFLLYATPPSETQSGHGFDDILRVA